MNIVEKYQVQDNDGAVIAEYDTKAEASEFVDGCKKGLTSDVWPEWKQDRDGDWCLAVKANGLACSYDGSPWIRVDDNGVTATVSGSGWYHKFDTIRDAQLHMQERCPDARRS